MADFFYGVIAGRLIKDPFFKISEKGIPILTLLVVCNNNQLYNDKKEVIEYRPTFIKAVVFNKKAEMVSKLELKARDRVCCIGKLVQEQWEKDGIHYSTVKMFAKSVFTKDTDNNKNDNIEEMAEFDFEGIPF